MARLSILSHEPEWAESNLSVGDLEFAGFELSWVDDELVMDLAFADAETSLDVARSCCLKFIAFGPEAVETIKKVIAAKP